MRKILVILSDTHAGHRLGLMNPKTVLFDEQPDGGIVPYYPSLTASQEYLWGTYTAQVKQAVDFAAGDEILVLHNGDETQGIKYRDQLVSSRLADQLIIAENNLSIWYEIPNVKHVRFSAGTGAHNFGESSSTILVVNALKNRYPEIDTAVCSHGLIDYNGVSIDYAHHGPGTGSRNWLYGNVARYYLRDLQQRAILSGQKPPDIVARAHVHTPVYEYLETAGHESHFIITPSYCMLGEHGLQVVKSPESIVHGLAVFEIIDGHITGLERFYATLDMRTKEVI